jgi:DMSO/TMAO reductase YedYZ molybdopterin-dependent catalytic subunit
VPPPDGVAHRRGLGALIGVLVAAIALGVGQLVAALVAPGASPIVAVGQAAVDLSPQPLKSFAIRSFGSADKTVLVVGIIVVLALASAWLGGVALRRPPLGFVGIAALAGVGLAAALTRPDATGSWVLPTLVGAGAAGLAFATLEARAAAVPDAMVVSDASVVVPVAADAVEPKGFDRRRFLAAALAVGAAAGATGAFGAIVARDRSRVAAARAAVRIPAPRDPAPPLPSGAELDVDGLAPFFTPNADFYRVDTALLVPSVDVRTWTLRIHGMVEREIVLDFDRLIARPLIERDVTLACVSNPIGGHYIGNARWIGARLAPILEEAGVHPDADQIVSRSVDGMTIGTPTRVALDGRDAMLAVGMNGRPLPVEHGFPVRMIVPGLYGYESATKWITDIELTTFDAYDAYWVQRGWAQETPIETGSRIDVPRGGSRLGAGPVIVAGIAWAQHRGISRVEVRVDDGPWNDASPAAQDSIDTWRQWAWRWDATPGPHALTVRATDGTGAVQPEVRAQPFPSGATGWHAVEVTID